MDIYEMKTKKDKGVMFRRDMLWEWTSKTEI